MWYKSCLLIFGGLCAGVFTASGFCAVITSIGLITRLAQVTKTEKRSIFYENLIILGAISGAIVEMFDVNIPFGVFVTIVIMVLSGMFTGLFSVCLAESIKIIPVFARRTKFIGKIGVIILAIALGKAAGQLFYYLKLYN